MTGDPLAVLLDKQAITEVLCDYARAADRIDVELLKSVFHPDAPADYGAMFTGTGHGFADFIGAVHPTMEAHHRQLGNITVRVDGDRAGSESYVIVRLRHRGADGSLTDTLSYGRYVDEWQRRDGRWRISRRRYLHDLDESRPVSHAGFPTLGTRDRTDPSYATLSLRGPDD